MSARDPRDEVEDAYHAACRICLALFRLSNAVKENQEALCDDAIDKPWPETLFKPFCTLAKQIGASWQATAASVWIPPRPTEICGITETSMHAAMSACADRAAMTLAMGSEFGRPSAKEALSRYADFPAEWVDGMLRVERLQAEAAIEKSEQTANPAIVARENQAAPKSNDPPASPAVRDRDLEARDKWIYGECCKGTPYDTIANRLKKKSRRWPRIESKQGVRAAAIRYAERHKLPEIPRRQDA